MVAATQFAVAAMRSRACHLHHSRPAEQALAIQSSPFFRSADACRSGITRRTPLGSQVSRSEAGNHFRLAHLGKKPERPSACPLSGHGGRDRRRGAVCPSGREDTAPRPRAHGGLSRKIPSRAESGNPSRSTHNSQSDDGRLCAIAAESARSTCLERANSAAISARSFRRRISRPLHDRWTDFQPPDPLGDTDRSHVLVSRSPGWRKEADEAHS